MERNTSEKLGFQFHRQVLILPYIVDFYCHKLFLAIEIDGNSHNNKFMYDAQRENRLQEQGLKIIHIPNINVLNNLNGIINFLQKEIEERKHILNE